MIPSADEQFLLAQTLLFVNDIDRFFRSKLHVMVNPSSSNKNDQKTSFKLATVNTLKNRVKNQPNIKTIRTDPYTIGL